MGERIGLRFFQLQEAENSTVNWFKRRGNSMTHVNKSLGRPDAGAA